MLVLWVQPGPVQLMVMQVILVLQEQPGQPVLMVLQVPVQQQVV